MKSKKRKPAKAITLLTRIETLLADALDEFSVMEKGVEKNVQELLFSAKASISEAIDFISPTPSAKVRHKVAKSRPRAVKGKAKRAVRARKLSAVRAA